MVNPAFLTSEILFWPGAALWLAIGTEVSGGTLPEDTVSLFPCRIAT
jgi:hypothetical protein